MAGFANEAMIYTTNPLAELNQCVLDSANGLVIYIIDVL